MRDGLLNAAFDDNLKYLATRRGVCYEVLSKLGKLFCEHSSRHALIPQIRYRLHRGNRDQYSHMRGDLFIGIICRCRCLYLSNEKEHGKKIFFYSDTCVPAGI